MYSLGGLFFTNNQEQASQEMQALMAIQQYRPGHYCLHGKDCPICLEISKKNEEARIQREEDLKKKRLDYELRCKKYLDNFRKNLVL
jgi:hypothetical protein